MRGADFDCDAHDNVRRAISAQPSGSAIRVGPTTDARAVFDALLRFLASSDAEMMLVSPEDLWGG